MRSYQLGIHLNSCELHTKLHSTQPLDILQSTSIFTSSGRTSSHSNLSTKHLQGPGHAEVHYSNFVSLAKLQTAVQSYRATIWTDKT